MLLKIAVVALIALALATLTVLVTAFVTDRAWVLTTSAMVVLVASNILGHYGLLGYRFGSSGAGMLGITSLLLLAIFYLLILMPGPAVKFPDLAGVQYWDLITGSRIAYLRLAPEQPSHPEPIIFLHGGPGVGDLEGNAAFFGRLRDEGHVIYIYDQVGAGRSSRLQEPTGYTIARDADDLEQIRKQIGAERIVLMGHSYGAGLAVTYIAHHGQHVSKFVAISPGALVGGVEGGGDLQSRLSTRQKIATYWLLLQPRSLLVYMLLQANPSAAHSFAGDAEMDARNDDIYATTEPALHCEPYEAARRLTGVGFYANQFPQSARRAQPEDIRPLLGQYTIPTLVIKGSCDYMSWASGMEYLEAFRQGPAEMVYLSEAGHNTFDDKPDEVERNIRAFLRNQPTPDTYTGTAVPADFEMGH